MKNFVKEKARHQHMIDDLPSTTFYGKRFTRKQLRGIQQTTKNFPSLSRRELAHTVCEHLQWLTPKGKHRIQSCLGALEAMEKTNILKLPAIREQKRAVQKPISWTDKTTPHPLIEDTLEQLMPITLEKVVEKEAVKEWNEWVSRYHYLGYKRPIGTHLRYFIVDRHKRKLGCFLFSFAVWSLACRDTWIGWERAAREKRIGSILNNNRFLIFPWVKVHCLASKALSLVTGQIAQDWYVCHGYRPVLLETFVDVTKYKGTCYQAANWQCLGKTAGRNPSPSFEGISQKAVYVYPLVTDFRSVLVHGKKVRVRKKSNPLRKPSPPVLDDTMIGWWQKIISILVATTETIDQEWQKRRRALNTLLLVLFIFRLVFSKNKQGYGITILELWEQCRRMQVPLPQSKPVAASAFCNARAKLQEDIFKRLNSKIIREYDTAQAEHLWKQHRLFAVDGTKINLPRQLHKAGYSLPMKQTYYPQGLVSCLYQLKSKIPTDFDLFAHHDERVAALTHLSSLRKDDVVVYDRGYFSYVMLYRHYQRGIQAIFRLKKKSFQVINVFVASDETDQLVIIDLSLERQRIISKAHPQIACKPLALRLIKYVVKGTTYVLGTTLIDTQRYPAAEFADLYHARWGIEELYKISKELIEVEDFHGQSERGVKQELFAHFVLITLSRIFSHQTEDSFYRHENAKAGEKCQVNVKNALIVLARHIEGLFLQQTSLLKESIHAIVSAISLCRQKQRPNRSYKRQSRKPSNKWRQASRVKKSTQTQAAAG